MFVQENKTQEEQNEEDNKHSKKDSEINSFFFVMILLQDLDDLTAPFLHLTRYERPIDTKCSEEVVEPAQKIRQRHRVFIKYCVFHSIF